MIDVKILRKEPEKVKEGIKNKGVDPKLVDKFLRLDDLWRKKTKALDDLKSEQNKLSKSIANNKNEEMLKQAQILKDQILKLKENKKETDEKRDKIILSIPNLPSEDAPVGIDENSNQVIKKEGKIDKFNFKPQDYLSIAENLGIINVDKAGEISGSRFGYLIGDAVLLEFALVQFAFSILLEEGFIPVVPPVMVRPEIMKKMGKTKFIEEKDAFYISDDNLYLVGSSEHSIGPLNMNTELSNKDLPKRYAGFSTCFRREAGSYGKDTKGILRVHQFDKVEMFSFVHPKKSEEEHKFLIYLQEKMMKALKLPYQLVSISTGDMGWADAKQFDIETWLPSERQYRETHSASNTTDFQARGINARYKTKEGKLDYVHMLNATAFAIGRIIIAIIENYQTKDGEVIIPEVLRSYVGKEKITK